MTALFSSGELANIRKALLAMYRPHFRRVAANELHFQRMARDSISEERSLEHLRALERDVGPLAENARSKSEPGPDLHLPWRAK